MRGFKAVKATLAVVAIGGLSLTFPAFAAATPGTLYVAGSGGVDAGAAADTGSCSTESTPCATLAYAITQASPGDTIDISGSLSEGAATTINLDVTLAENPDGSSATIDGNGGDSDGLLTIVGPQTVTVRGLTLLDGFNSGPGGGAISNATGNLTVTDSTLSQNTATRNGGAIDSTDSAGGGSVTVTDSTLSDNTAFSDGGAIDNTDGGAAGSLTVTDSVLFENTAFTDGGAIDNNDSGGFRGSATIVSSTLTGNYAGGDGGAVDNNDNDGFQGTLTITDSTFTGDIASGNGAEIDNNDTFGYRGTVYLGGSVLNGVCNNVTAGAGSWSDAGYNAATDGSCLGDGPVSTDAPIGPDAGDLSPLSSYGGPTQTILLDQGNPALGLIPYGTADNSIPNATLECSTTDQRGVASAAGQPCDAGAVQQTAQTAYASGAGGDNVGAASDSNDCSDPSTPCATVQAAVDQGAPGGTVALSGNFSQSQAINLAQDVTVETNPGDASAATIDGNAQDTSGLMDVTYTGGTVAVDGLTLENGYNTASYGGGAITHNVGGQLVVNDSTLSGNSAENGGAIDNNDATSGGLLTIIDSTLTGNFAPDGGAIDNNDNNAGGGSVTIIDSTLSGNSAADGGAIDSSDNNGSSGSLTVTDSTIASNTAVQLGEEIGNSHYGTSGSVYLGADVIAGTCTNDGNSGWWTDAGYNAASDSSCLGAAPAGTDATIESAAADLGPLANNGGQTETQALAPDNSGIAVMPHGTSFTTGPGNAVDVSCPVSADQRGVASASAAACDAGAVQYVEQTLTFGSGVASAAVVGQSGVTVAASSSSGLAPTLSLDGALTTHGACTLSGDLITLAHAGSCVIDAEQGGNQNVAPATTVAHTITVHPAATSTGVTDAGGTLTATVSAVSPGTGTPTGTVQFEADSEVIGTASVGAGTAKLAYAAPAGTSQQVTASYLGSDDYTASSSTSLTVSAALTSGTTSTPSISAKLSSRRPRSRLGWWTAPVTVTFTCHSDGAALRTSCPAPVTLGRSGRHQSLHRLIATTTGQTASLNISGINIDLARPLIRIAGPNPHLTYQLKRPAARCRATEHMSGIRSCRLSARTTNFPGGYVVHYTAHATSNAGVTAARREAIRVSNIRLVGAVLKRRGAYAVRPGHGYVLEVLSKTRPTYLNAAPAPLKPTPPNQYFARYGSIDGIPLWTVTIRITPGFARFPAWTIGVRAGRTTSLLHLLT